MTAILIFHGGSHVKVTEEWDVVCHDLEHAEHSFHYFATDGTYPNDPRIGVRVDAVIAVIEA